MRRLSGIPSVNCSRGQLAELSAALSRVPRDSQSPHFRGLLRPQDPATQPPDWWLAKAHLLVRGLPLLTFLPRGTEMPPQRLSPVSNTCTFSKMRIFKSALCTDWQHTERLSLVDWLNKPGFNHRIGKHGAEEKNETDLSVPNVLIGDDLKTRVRIVCSCVFNKGRRKKIVIHRIFLQRCTKS